MSKAALTGLMILSCSGSAEIVYASLITALSVIPDFTAMALIVTALVTGIGPLYSGLLPVGTLPSSV
ncbi:hypothetical protein D3C86_2169210 [compost metagenome]